MSAASWKGGRVNGGHSTPGPWPAALFAGMPAGWLLVFLEEMFCQTLVGRAICLTLAGSALGLAVNQARPDGVRFTKFAAPNSCGVGAAAAAAPDAAPVQVLPPAEAVSLCGDLSDVAGRRAPGRRVRAGPRHGRAAPAVRRLGQRGQRRGRPARGPSHAHRLRGRHRRRAAGRRRAAPPRRPPRPARDRHRGRLPGVEPGGARVLVGPVPRLAARHE